MTITAKSAVYFMIANPIGHAKSPGMFNALFEREGIDAVMVPVSFAVESFEACWTAFEQIRNLRGLIVSVPFKAIACSRAARVNPRAARVGTANAIVREADGSLLCDNFDGAGFVEGMRRGGHAIGGRRALLVGAGGAGASIAFCLAEEGATALTIHDVDGQKAADLAARVRSLFPACDARGGVADPTGHDLVVNATPMGLAPSDPLPLAVDRLHPAMTVVDIVMEPRETALLRAAQARGCRIQPGQPMMDCQMDLLAEFLRVREKRDDQRH